MPDFVGTLKPPRLATAPSSPSSGQSYFDTVLNASRYWNGTAWVTTDLRYNGDWAAGSYTDGDIVVYGGTSYLCVRPTSSAPAGWTPVYSATGYGTSLPASPVDGQQHVLVDSATNPTYQWAFRFNNGSSSAYKWEFIGGTPLRSLVTTNEATSNTGSVSLTTPGPQFTIPRSGEYLLDLGAGIYVTGGNTAMMEIYVNAVASGKIVYGGAAIFDSVRASFPPVAITAGWTVTVLYRVSGGTGNYFDRHLSVIPARVS